MYEDVTYEVILKRMLDKVKSQTPGIDTREGSIVYDALAPAAAELQNLYIQLDWMADQSFADSQNREYLVRRCAERGIIPSPASKAVLKGEFNQDVPVGARFSLGILNFAAVGKIGDGVYQMECESYGIQGNQNLGMMVPIEYIKGLTKAELTEVLIPGEDEEETEHLRKRYFASLNSQAYGGNIADYKEKVNSITGVGGVKVFPAWNGGGTVKLVMISSEYKTPSRELVAFVQETVDPLQNTGKGYGLAPIGHVVTVAGAGETKIDIATRLTYQTGWDYQRCEEAILEAVDRYLDELNRTWEDSQMTVVRVSRIESRLLDVEGIMDAADTVINGKSGNFQLPADSIAVRGEFSGA